MPMARVIDELGRVYDVPEHYLRGQRPQSAQDIHVHIHIHLDSSGQIRVGPSDAPTGCGVALIGCGYSPVACGVAPLSRGVAAPVRGTKRRRPPSKNRRRR